MMARSSESTVSRRHKAGAMAEEATETPGAKSEANEEVKEEDITHEEKTSEAAAAVEAEAEAEAEAGAEPASAASAAEEPPVPPTEEQATDKEPDAASAVTFASEHEIKSEPEPEPPAKPDEFDEPDEPPAEPVLKPPKGGWVPKHHKAATRIQCCARKRQGTHA